MVWNHQHNSQDNVLGHALLENREEGVYAYCTFNDTESGQTAKKLVQHGDVSSLSICANQLKQMGHDVVHVKNIMFHSFFSSFRIVIVVFLIFRLT